MRVIYVDVLFVVNFFMTFLLLLLTGKLLKRDHKLVRFVIASVIGAVYALVILIDDMSFLLTIFGKIIIAFAIVFAAFGFRTARNYLKSVALFFFSNMVLLGVMIGLWFIFEPSGVVIHNSVVYFDVSAKVLLVSAFIAYVLSYLIIRIYNATTAKKDIFDLTVEKNGKCVHMFAFADSGNNLTEPFSSHPVIVVKKDLFKEEQGERVIPYETVGGEGVLTAFKPDKVTVKASGKMLEVENVYIALSDYLGSEDYSAIINPKIIE